MSLPAWFNKKESEVAKSRRQEKIKAKELGDGKMTIGSGSVFSENDVRSSNVDAEIKRTESSQYILKKSTWDKLRRRTKGDRMSALLIDLEPPGESSCKLAVIDYSDYLYLLSLLQK